MVDTEQLTDLINQSKSLIVSTSKMASNSDIGKSLKDELNKSSESIQTILNGILYNNNVVTNQQLSDLDEQMRLAKSKLLEAESRKTMKKITTYGGIILLSFGFLWYLTKDK